MLSGKRLVVGRVGRSIVSGPFNMTLWLSIGCCRLVASGNTATSNNDRQPLILAIHPSLFVFLVLGLLVFFISFSLSFH